MLNLTEDQEEWLKTICRESEVDYYKDDGCAVAIAALFYVGEYHRKAVLTNIRERTRHLRIHAMRKYISTLDREDQQSLRSMLDNALSQGE